MSPAQIAALERAAQGPTPIAPATFRVLERYRPALLERTAAGFVITDAGRRVLARRDAELRRAALERHITPAARAWARRVDSLLEVLEVLDWRRRVYARHVLECDESGLIPIHPGWSTDVVETVQERARAAARIVRDYDAEREVAKARGVGLTIGFTADRIAPGPPRTALERASRDDGTVSLHTYRARRGRDRA